MSTSISVPLFWCGEGGSMGISLAISLTRGLPEIDLTTITDARLRLETAGGAVSYLTAEVVRSTATTATIRHALGPSSFAAIGTWRLWGEVSIDGGAAWYPTSELALRVTA